MDAGEAFVKATYNLEGDGPLVLRCYEILSTLTAGIQVGHYPNVQAIARILSGGSPVTFQQWVEYANTCINRLCAIDALLRHTRTLRKAR